MKKWSIRVFLLISFYWAIGGFTITPILKEMANEIGFIIVWSWLVIILLFVAKTIVKIKGHKNTYE